MQTPAKMGSLFSRASRLREPTHRSLCVLPPAASPGAPACSLRKRCARCAAFVRRRLALCRLAAARLSCRRPALRPSLPAGAGGASCPRCSRLCCPPLRSALAGSPAPALACCPCARPSPPLALRPALPVRPPLRPARLPSAAFCRKDLSCAGPQTRAAAKWSFCEVRPAGGALSWLWGGAVALLLFRVGLAVWLLLFVRRARAPALFWFLPLSPPRARVPSPVCWLRRCWRTFRGAPGPRPPPGRKTSHFAKFPVGGGLALRALLRGVALRLRRCSGCRLSASGFGASAGSGVWLSGFGRAPGCGAAARLLRALSCPCEHPGGSLRVSSPGGVPFGAAAAGGGSAAAAAALSRRLGARLTAFLRGGSRRSGGRLLVCYLPALPGFSLARVVNNTSNTKQPLQNG